MQGDVRQVRSYPPRENKLPFLKEYQNKIVIFAFRQFKFCPVYRSCLIHNELFKDNNCSIAIQIAVVWFRCVYLRVFLQLSKLDYHYFLVNQAPALCRNEVSLALIHIHNLLIFIFFYNLLLFIALRVTNKVVSSLSLLQPLP